MVSTFSLSLNAEIAKKYGVTAGIIYNHILYWLRFNAKKKNVEIVDGYVWMYETQKEMAEFFEFISEDEVQRALKKLLESGIILSRNLSKNKFDRTKAYTASDPRQYLEECVSKKVYDTAPARNASRSATESDSAPVRNASLYNTLDNQEEKQEQHPIPPKGGAPIGAGGGNKIQYLDNIFLSSEESEKLQAELGKEMFENCLQELSEWKTANPKEAKKKKSDYLVIKKWVITAVRERQIREKKVELAEIQLKRQENALNTKNPNQRSHETSNRPDFSSYKFNVYGDTDDPDSTKGS